MPQKQPLKKTTNNELKHIDCWPTQGILCSCTGGEERCVDLEIWV